jgi:hypothetical protein
MNKNNEKDIVIFNADTVKRLLERGYTIIDLKPDKKDPDSKKTLFIFKFGKDIFDYIKKKEFNKISC